ncbi:hypothetical protein K474DRAFT_1666141 [Panus rudis PR-1116 ss-1]|nr:hypothetical protein K474DRAFT_1666141 [Panus rudis PR-1116 ss-1]
MDPATLSASQREAFDQIQALTNGGDPEVAINVLESVNWDVQRAADMIFESTTSAPSTTSRPPEITIKDTSNANIETFDVDDSRQGLLSGEPSSRGYGRPSSGSSTPLALIVRPLRFILTILAVPFHIIRAFFRIIGIPLPQLPVTLSGLSVYYRHGSSSASRPELRTDPRSAAERWVRSLEEETGAVCIGKASRAGEGASSSVGPSTSAAGLVSRKGVDEDGERVLPDFFIGSYEEFARACARDTDPRIGCVIIVSEEHDDVPEFKRSTLTDPTFVRLMHENNFLVWGGDIRDRDAWSASQKLQATTYPFVAFIALQPRRGPSTRTSGPPPSTLTILSRHQGPSIPRGSAPTSAETLVTHLKESLLPRVQPFLTRVREQVAERENIRTMEQAQRERERALRAEQDRAFQESQRRDKERIEARIAEEKRLAEEKRRTQEREMREKLEAERREKERQEWEAKRMVWRRWGRRHLLPREPRPGVVEPARGKTIRVGVRMPDGKRGVRFFGEGDSLTALYAFVDTLFIPSGPEFSSDLDPVSPPDGAPSGEEGLVKTMEDLGRTGEDWWGFKLLSSYPRREIQWEPSKRIGDVDGLKGGGQLVVELVDADAKRAEKGKGKATVETQNGDDDDGYKTESDSD